MLGANLPAPRRSRPVKTELFWEDRSQSLPLQELLRLQKEAQETGDPEEEVEKEDLVVVVKQGRRLFGRICSVVYADESVSLEVLPIQEVDLGQSDLSVDLRFGRKRQGKGSLDPQAVKRQDVLKLPWPALREVPKPMTEQHLIQQDWEKHSNKRFSPGRLYTTWREMDGSTRRHYRQLSSRAIEVHQQMLMARFHIFNVLKELIDLAPGPQINGYFLYQQKQRVRRLAAKAPENADKELAELAPWSQMKEEFEQLASMENAKLKHKQQLWIEVCLGAGWTLERSAFFPRSALKCMLTLLLCQKRRFERNMPGLLQHIWLEHIFPYTPCYWFAKVS